MKNTLILLGIIMVFAGFGCGGGGSSSNDTIGAAPNTDAGCNFKFSDIYNGTNKAKINSHWRCSGNDAIAYFAIFADGTGVSAPDLQTTEEGFTWKQTGCRSMELTDSQGITETTNIQGSSASGIYTYSATNSGQTITVACTLNHP